MELTVHIGSILTSYTNGLSEVAARGDDVAALLRDLDSRYPGLAFRVVDEREQIRPHVKLFLDSDSVTDTSTLVDGHQTLHILGALSGG